MTEKIKREEQRNEIIRQAADILSAYVSNNAVSTADLPRLIARVHDTLREVRDGSHEKTVDPAVPVQKAVSRDHVICLVCGAKQKVLRRHIHTTHGLSDQEYRNRYKLPHDVPLVAPAYARERSQWAKKMGLGKNRSKRANTNRH